jgi:beta-lactamase regulating signal transducer with metallopeptidase domain
MNFALRGLLMTFSSAVLIYVCASLLVIGTWRDVWHFAKMYSAATCADLLFSFRIAPLGIAIGITAAFVMPSFLWLEPRKVMEPVGGLPLALGICGVAAMIVGVRNSLQALRKASRMVARWARASVGSELLDGTNSVAVMRSAAAPPLTAAGILRPAVWLSRSAEAVLTLGELESALRHEIVHVRRRDNLRKLVLRLMTFPGMRALEGAWLEAAEMAADDAAVSSAAEALDLACAVIKLSQLGPLEAPGELTTALVHSPIGSLDARVQRLVAWEELHEPTTKESSSRLALSIAATSATVLVLSYGHLLFAMHAATELLMR